MLAPSEDGGEGGREIELDFVCACVRDLGVTVSVECVVDESRVEAESRLR